MTKLTFASLLLITGATCLSLLVFDQLPDPMPSHWNLKGEIDGYTPLPWGAYLIPGISALTFVTLSLLPRISPKNFTMNDFVGSYQKVIFALVAFLFVIHCIMLWSVISPMANEATISTSILGQWLPVCLGVLFTVIGNFLNKTKRNFFFGIRTPWTLADSEVWARTHRVGGWMFLLAGISCILAGLLVPHPYAMGVVLASIISTVIGATLYSFILYRRIHTPA